MSAKSASVDAPQFSQKAVGGDVVASKATGSHVGRACVFAVSDRQANRK